MRPRRDNSTNSSIRISSSHASLSGHFPENPLVPGAVILDEIIARLEKGGEFDPHLPVLESAKFVRPLRPDETVDLRITQRTDSIVRIEGFVNNSKIFVAICRYGQKSEPGL